MFRLLCCACVHYHEFEIADSNVLFRLVQYFIAILACSCANHIIVLLNGLYSCVFIIIFLHAFFLKNGLINEAVIWHQI